jgi:hypothetical protein
MLNKTVKYISGVAIDAWAYLKAILSDNCPMRENIPATDSLIKTP